MFKPYFLQAFVLFIILRSTLAHTLGRSQNGSVSDCRCFPVDQCWPTAAEWAAFNETIDGKLIATVPIASICHHDSFAPYDAGKCEQLQEDWLLPQTHYTSSSSIMGQFFANMSCDPFTDPSAQCVLGTYVQYAVNATGQGDFRTTMAFATDRNIRFVVRNTGHDYFGKSTGSGALGLWTHNMKDIEFFEYSSCNYTGKAMKMGAGVQVMEALTAAHNQGLVVAGGQCQSLAVAGGYTQGGGHSFMASLIGLSADQVLEWEAVTATGEYLVATPSDNEDLYWALSGGGGGTYAAVLSVTVKAYPDLEVAAANLTFTISEGVSTESFFAVVQTWLQNLPAIVDAGAVALWTLADGYFSVSPVFGPNLTVSELQVLLQPTLTALNQSGIPYSSYFAGYPTFLDAYNAMNPFEPVTDGNMGAYLLPRELVTSETNASALTDVLNKLVTGTSVVTGGVSLNVARGQDITQPVANSINPAWRDAIHYFAFGLPYNRTSLPANVEEWNLITNVYGPSIDALVPGGMSSYLNEGNPFDPDWKRVFYGDNYNRLLDIKERYDPNSIFYGLTCVGSDGWEVQEDGRLCRV
ncbi:FAD binding domain-containing protein [Mollisia scopiformis]|uniref:FAD binding domain-containing protein n=1 Tax=Mollisia scopiformis TaxID=149040 RepID=A0A132B5M6_MOLSC|nr:FAD binding domain-containing protein [Mollisia scopiformis]KUJ07710.1 FAD binding domain-containing protein [Mollisia scopiformis]